MTTKQKERIRLQRELVETLEQMGYPEAFGLEIADRLGTEMTMSRMIGYLRSARPGSPEEIVDEMLAILEDRYRWTKKKESEFYNRKYNELLYFGLGAADDSLEDESFTGEDE